MSSSSPSASSSSRALVRRAPGDLVRDPLDPSEFDEKTDPAAQTNALAPYLPPIPGKTWRSLARFSVLVGGSAAIGIGVASGGVTFAGAALMAVGLATAQVLAQTWRQNRLGQAVVGGISLGDLDVAQQAAELALTESPAGVMRTLAASNLASVLIQRDRLEDAAHILDRYPPGVFAMPLATILWLNNRAFAHLALDEEGAGDVAGPLLDDAERRLDKASARDLGGPQNGKKLLAAVCGTRAIERVAHRDGRSALAYLERARQVDDGASTAYRTVERELCRAEALRLVGRQDEAIVAAESLTETPMTERQKKRRAAVHVRLGIG